MILRASAVLGAALAMLAADVPADTRSFEDRPDLPAEQARSGSSFLTPETLALQEDSFANPGYLWVDRGATLFQSNADSRSCASCHTDGGDKPLQGAAARYPQVDSGSGALLNLEARINQCRQRHQARPALPYESEDLLALTAYVASLSRGLPLDVSIEGEAKPWFEAGRRYFFSRRGQLNLACNQCHDDNWGRMLRGDRISQGHPSAWPGYRLEWQTFGSLHRRLRDCDAGVRAEPAAPGSLVYSQVELYLAWRARGLSLESPGVRR